MNIRITFQGTTQSLDVDNSMTTADLLMIAAMEVNATPEDHHLEFNGSKLPTNTTTLLQNNIPNNANLYLKSNRKRSSNSTNRDILSAAFQGLKKGTQNKSIPKIDFSSINVGNIQTVSTPTTVSLSPSETSHYRMMFHMLKTNPSMKAQLSQTYPGALEAVANNNQDKFLEYFRKIKEEEQTVKKKMFAAIANPDAPETKKYLEDVKKKEDIAQNLNYTMEYHPEAFGRVFMLYISCKINGNAVKAFIDSGAQFSIMNLTTAKTCKIDNLIDERFQGVAQGVGTRKIMGQIHCAQLQIETGFFATTFHIMDDDSMPLIIGLEFLKRHQASIDLAKNALVLPHSNIETRFLNENELPAQINASMDTSPDTDLEKKVSQITEMGYSRQQAEQALQQAGGSLELAISML